MIDIMFELPSQPGQKRVVITRDTVEKLRPPEIFSLAKSA
jgi:ATP-dependent protease Clp ATPase subunit